MKRRFFLGGTCILFILSILAGVLFMCQPVQADQSKYPQFAQQSPPANVSLISVDKLADEVRAGKKPLIIDVRSEEEYREAHILGALSAPLAEFHSYLQSIPKDRLVVLY
ncbi:MAG TPA: rhodanese-like domain-containing protein [Candidatus Binatia bacterium]|nr:rhodanese-like domain-containing protein [Candidatus Binatia bacterium]